MRVISEVIANYGSISNPSYGGVIGAQVNSGIRYAQMKSEAEAPCKPVYLGRDAIEETF